MEEKYCSLLFIQLGTPKGSTEYQLPYFIPSQPKVVGESTNPEYGLNINRYILCSCCCLNLLSFAGLASNIGLVTFSFTIYFSEFTAFLAFRTCLNVCLVYQHLLFQTLYDYRSKFIQCMYMIQCKFYSAER